MIGALLLDTCTALWFVAGAGMAEPAIHAISQARQSGTPLYVSPVTAWEIGLLARKGRFRSTLSPQRWFENLCSLPGVQLCGLSPEILIASSFLPGQLPDDPADRIMAATAREQEWVLMTRDRALLKYAAEGHLKAIAC